jgi:cytochrome c-type biogenesis protein CcmH
MTLWFVFTLMTAAAIFAVLWPLARREGGERAGSDLAVYRDQLNEIGRDREAGLIAEADAEAARIEISRRLLAAAEADGTAGDGMRPLPVWRRRVVAVIALFLLPIAATALYIRLGSPALPGAPLYARQSQPLQQRSIASLVAQIEDHLARNPDDGRGWEVVAPVYMQLGRFDDAVRARRNALRLLGETAEREVDLGEALVAEANGVVTKDAKALFDQAAARDAANVKAQFFLGLAAEQDNDKAEAARIWRALLARGGADAPWRELVRQSLARVAPEGVAPGPGAADMAAADALSPDERNAMIRGMVERLAEKLHQDGSDVDGWLRLVRAYMVLGERDKARAAAADARKAVGVDADKQRRLDESLKGLGVEG